MAVKDWECTTKGCGHLQYQHINQGVGVAAHCTVQVTDELGNKRVCNCGGYQPPKGKKWA